MMNVSNLYFSFQHQKTIDPVTSKVVHNPVILDNLWQIHSFTLGVTETEECHFVEAFSNQGHVYFLLHQKIKEHSGTLNV